METAFHIVPKLDSSIRMQEYGVGIFNAILTKSALKKALKKKQITVNDTIATSATFIYGGERIVLSIIENAQPKKKLIFPLNVLYQDDYLALIHKPAGILVSGNTFKTITNALSQSIKESDLTDATTPQPIHRLDFATTGILLIGKTKRGILALNKLFEKREIQKIYYAIAIGKMPTQGSITAKIDGKESQSNYKIYASVPSKKFGTLNLVQLEPKTGRRHQLRKHLSSIGNPILGDKDYGIENKILHGKGLYLHAYSLKFAHPFTQEEIYVKDEFPQRFVKIFPYISEKQDTF